MKLNRRIFLQASAASAAGVVSSQALAAPEAAVTAQAIHNYLLANSPWVSPAGTLDGVKAGDPSKPITKAGVSWFPSFADLQAAQAAGCELLVCHEPPIWARWPDGWPDLPSGDEQRQFVLDHGMVVLRAHDSWDNWPELGVRDMWAKALGLTNRLRVGTYWNYFAMYEVAEQTLLQFAQYVAGRIRRLGEDSVKVMGDPDRLIHRPAISVGNMHPGRQMVEYGADVLIMAFDGPGYNRREYLHEMGGVPIITVEHGTCEMPGIEGLRDHLAEKFPSVEFVYFDKHPRTWTMRRTDAAMSARNWKLLSAARL
jgi:putative NIF3 family GTP cyclohydrolase 1 type 2